MQAKVARIVRKIKTKPLIALKWYTGVYAGVAITAAGYTWYKKNFNAGCNVLSKATVLYFASQSLILKSTSISHKWGYALSMIGISLMPTNYVLFRFVAGMPMYTYIQDSAILIGVLWPNIFLATIKDTDMDYCHC